MGPNISFGMRLFGIMTLLHISATTAIDARLNARLSRHIRSHASKQFQLQLKQADEINAETEVAMDAATHVFKSWKLRVKGTDDFENDFVAFPGMVTSGGSAPVRAAATSVDGTTNKMKKSTIRQLKHALSDKVEKVATVVKRDPPVDRHKIKVAFASVSFAPLFSARQKCPAKGTEAYSKKRFAENYCWYMDGGFPLEKSARELNHQLLKMLKRLHPRAELEDRTSGVVLLDSAGDDRRSRLADDVVKKLIQLNNENPNVHKLKRIAHSPSDPWLNKIRPDTQINELTIPGTHDSGAFKLLEPKPKHTKGATGPSSEELEYIKKKATLLTQSWSLKHQLDAGIRYFDIRLAFKRDDDFHAAFYNANNPLMLTHAGVNLKKKWTDVVQLFVEHMEKMEGKTDFIMFTLKPERGNPSMGDFAGPVYEKIAVHKSGFRHFYHYAMTEAYNHINEKSPRLATKYFSPFNPDGAPVSGTTLGDVNHKIVIVLNDYDGGINGITGNPDVDLLHKAVGRRVYSGLSSLAQGAMHAVQGAGRIASQAASALTEIQDSRALG